MHEDATDLTTGDAVTEERRAQGDDPQITRTDRTEELARRRVNRRLLMAATAVGGVAATAMAVPGLRAQEEGTPEPGPTSAEEAVEQVETLVPGDDQHMVETGRTKGGFQYFVPFQASIIQAAAARLIPTDDLGPGATEADVVRFIDQQLQQERIASRGYRGQRYSMGPYRPGEVTQGDQSALPMSERFRIGILGLEGLAQERYQSGFVGLTPEQQDDILRSMDQGEVETFGRVSLTTQPAVFEGGDQGIGASTGQTAITAKAFFELLLAYTIAGFFVDPVHGGNRDMVGWKMIGFPGAQIGYGNWIERYGEPFDGPYLSLADHQTAMSGGA